MTNSKLNHINTRLGVWYTNAKLDFGVIGSAKARIENEKVIIDYTENGENFTWSMSYKYNENVDFFNVWAEEAQIIKRLFVYGQPLYYNILLKNLKSNTMNEEYITITKQELEILKCKLELSEQALIVALEKRESDAAQITLWKILAKKRK